MELTKGGRDNSKLHLTVEAHGMSLRTILTSGTVADCTVAPNLLKALAADYLLADRGYDSDSIIKQTEEQGMQPVIPPRKHRKHDRRECKNICVNGILRETFRGQQNAYQQRSY